MKLLLHLFNFFSKWHLGSVKHVLCFFLSRIWSRISKICKRLNNLLLRIKSLKNTLIDLSLLLLSLLSFFDLHLKKLNLLIHNSDLLLIFLLFYSILLFNLMKFFQASIASILQNLVDFIFILIDWSEANSRSYRWYWTLSSFIITYLRCIACILVMGVI